MFAAAIPSLWLPIVHFLSEMLAHTSKIMITRQLTPSGHVLGPRDLIQLRTHFEALKEATNRLAKETHSGALSESYHHLREEWISLFAPAQTVLHNLDPMALSALSIYSPALASLLGRAVVISERTLAEALAAERTELDYDTEAHLCTLCLQIVREWSESRTIAGGLTELTQALADTIACLDEFVRINWSVKELPA